MKKVMLFVLMLLTTVMFAQRSYVKSGTYETMDTVVITSYGNASGSYSHVGYDSVKYWIAASDSVSVFIDRITMDPTLNNTAKGSWTLIDSLKGTTDNGTGTGFGNLVLSSLWQTATGVTGWNYGYRLRFAATGNPATSGTYRWGWLLKK